MDKTLSVVSVPDLHALGIDTVLMSALYFDTIYADSFLPEIKGFDKNPSKTHPVKLEFSLKSQLETFEPLTELISAGVILPLPSGTALTHSFDSQKLPLSLRRAVANSIEEGASLLSYPLGVLLLQQSKQSNSILIEDPAKTNNPAVEITMCMHLACIFTMLGVCSAGIANPLVSSAAHKDLLRELAKNFPSVAKALGVKDPSSLLPKQNALAMKILEETLPMVEVRNAVDILYLREEMSDELVAFRTEVGKLATMIESEHWDKQFHKEVQAIVAKEVKPSVSELRRRLQQPSKRMLSHLVSDWKSIATSAAVPVSAFVMTNASLPLSILAGIATGLGIAALKTKVEEWSVKRESSLTFLLEASRVLEE